MKSIVSLLVLALMLACGLMAADQSAAVGTWKCVSDGPDGGQYTWTLTVKDEGGKLSAALSGEDVGDYTPTDVTFADGVLSFKVEVQGEKYDIHNTITGDKLKGTWQTGNNKGSITGEKQS